LVIAPPSDERAPVRATPLMTGAEGQAAWAVMSAHGGAGASTLAQWWPQACDTGRAWPGCSDTTQLVVLAARTCMPGLVAASTRLREWHAQLAPEGVVVVALVLTPVRPGRLPVAVRRFRDMVAPLVAGGVYSLGWHEQLVTLEPRDLAPCRLDAGPLPPRARRGPDLTRAAPREVGRAAARITESIAGVRRTGAFTPFQ
jgi:hypothetical protein